MRQEIEYYNKRGGNMKVLLTGGAGFIGSHTYVELIKMGYEAVIADDFSNSKPSICDRLEAVAGEKPLVYAIDVADKRALSKVFEQNDIGAVVHFAGFKAVGESVTQPLRYYRNNLDTTFTLLEVMEQYGVKQLVFSSSATVYGVPEQVPLHEGMKTGCTNPYGWTKYMIERVLTDIAAANQELSVVLLRYFNPVGAHESGLLGEDPQGIPNNLMPYLCQVAAGKLDCLTVFGDDYPTKDGTGVRDYIHVCDLARGHVSALRYAAQHTGCEVFNLGTGVGYSVLELVKTFEAVNGVKVAYRIGPRRPGDVAQCYADPAKANRQLGWTATKHLEEMCRDAWRWQRYCMQDSRP